MVTETQKVLDRRRAPGATALESDGILTFVEWSQGCCSLETAVKSLAAGFGAKSCRFARMNIPAGTVRIARVDAPDQADYRAAEDCAAYRVFGEELSSLKPGAFVVCYQYMRERLFRDPAFDVWLSDQGFRDVAFVILGRSGGTVDLLEFYHTETLTCASIGNGEWGGEALARIYAARRPGVATDWFAQQQAEKQSCAEFDEPILGPGNMAGLTRCEWRVCVLVARGLSIKGIAYELDVAVPTIRAHLRNIYSKTGLHGFNTLALRLISGLEQRALHGRQIEVAA